MSKYEVVMFDLDGTLTDPKVGITKSIQYTLLKLGIKEDNPDKFTEFIGPPLVESFKRHYLLDDLRARRAVDFYRKYYAEKGIFETKIRFNMPRVLKQLHSNDMKLVLATSKPTVYAERILGHFDIHKYFLLVVGSILDSTLTHKDEIIGYIISSLTNYQKSQMVMVGDRRDDIVGAHHNGINSIAVTYGYGSIEELENVNPTHIVHSVEELKSLLI
jgi:phosphoglycolate phosphatase